jgi:2'-5' RNA ligase
MKLVDGVPWPADSTLEHHWSWRPEWDPARPCLYWYVTFTPLQRQAFDSERLLAAVRQHSWLDPVPADWLHLTVTDVGFDDELGPEDVDAVVRATRRALDGQRPLHLRLGPVVPMYDSVVVAAAPLRPLKELRDRVVSATVGALGPTRLPAHHDEDFWPHVSLGYVDRAPGPDEAAQALADVPEVDAEVTVDRLVLVAVTRRDRHYQWQERASLDLL